MRRETNFGYGFLFVGIGLSYLIGKVLGLTVAIVVCVACVVIGVTFLLAGHRHKDIDRPPRKLWEIAAFVCALSILIVLASIGILRVVSKKSRIQTAGEQTPSQQAQLPVVASSRTPTDLPSPEPKKKIAPVPKSSAKSVPANTTPAAGTQSTSGAGSPATGSISQGPGSALSFGQQGGITAGTVVVGPVDLAMSDTQRQQAQELLGAGSMSGVNVFVMVTGGATETTLTFARQLEKLLQDAGADVSEGRSMIYSPTGQTPVHKGLTLSYVPSKYQGAAIKFGNALIATGITFCPVHAYLFDAGDRIEMTVTPGSEPCR